MKTNASLGDLPGYCKLFGGQEASNMLEEFGRYGVAVAAEMKAIEGKLA
jgi:hypothetical protein